MLHSSISKSDAVIVAQFPRIEASYLLLMSKQLLKGCDFRVKKPLRFESGAYISADVKQRQKSWAKTLERVSG